MNLDRSRPPASGPVRPYDFPDIRRATLSSGVPIMVAEVHHFPVVTLGLVLPAGAVQEPPEAAGLASLTAELLDSGAGGRSGVEIAETVEGLGVQLDAGTGWETSQLELSALRSRLEAALPLMEDLLLRPTFPEDEVERLRAERIAELAQRRSDPRSLANMMATRFIFADASPYSRPLDGNPGTVESIMRSDVASFHADRYLGSGGGVVVAGALGFDEAVDLVERHFGNLGTGRASVPSVSVEPRARNRTLTVVHRPGAVQSELRVGHVGVPRSTPDFFPLLVGNTILGGAFSSRLNLNLRERRGFTYGAHSSLAMRRTGGVFSISTAVETEVTGAALSEILQEVGSMRESEVTPAEIDDARSYIAGIFPLRLQTTEGVAGRLVELLVHRLEDDYWDTYRDRVLAVSPAEVHAAMREHLRPEELAIVVVGDAEAIAPGLDGLGFGAPRVVDAEGKDLS
jgi:zinc protease